MQKPPPPMFNRLESIKVFMTPKMFRAVAILLGLFVGLPGAGALLHSSTPKRGPMPLPVPQLSETTEVHGWDPLAEVLNTIPKPGPNQKKAGTCNPKASQVEIRGGCWVQTTHPLPCPEGIQWEHDDGRCYLPVAEAKPVPQSGDPQVVNIAGEEE